MVIDKLQKDLKQQIAELNQENKKSLNEEKLQYGKLEKEILASKNEL